MFNERGCQAKPGALVVLNFRPNLRLAVLIELVLIKRKACTLHCTINAGGSNRVCGFDVICVHDNVSRNSVSRTGGLV